MANEESLKREAELTLHSAQAERSTSAQQQHIMINELSDLQAEYNRVLIGKNFKNYQYVLVNVNQKDLDYQKKYVIIRLL